MLAVPAVVLAVAMPSAAEASSLLSGYGGPGQGNQAILGSTLLNGPSNRGGGGSAGGGGSGSASLAHLAASAAVPTQEQGSAPSTRRHSTSSPAGGHRAGAGGRLVSPSSPADRSIPRLARSSAGGSGALGISGADLLFIILAGGALMLTALLTRQLARRDGASRAPTAKGIDRGTRGIE